MTRLTVLTAAFAAGLMTFAANAKDISKDLAKDDVANSVDIAKAAGKDLTKKTVGEIAETKKTTGKTAEEVSATKVAAVETKVDELKKAVKAAPAEKTEQRYSTIIARYAAMNGVSVSLAHAVVRVESNYRPDALGTAGEVGLMQIKPATARMMGYDGSTTGLFDPETNIKYGMKYLAKAQKLGDGTTCGTILKYNAGHGAKRMNPVSLNYCGKVKHHLAAGI
jgi:soluble lytic murein transglycosylase-like protein